MESIVLSEFRERYPTGSLIGELTSVRDGTYVVRAIVELEGKTIATGLAAASTVEEAEDRARIRALAVLGLSPPPLNSTWSPTIEPKLRLVAPEVKPHFSPPDILPPPEMVAARGEFSPEEADGARTPDDGSIEIEEGVEPTANIERLMNKTTVEIRRLGWSAAQGRSYLEQTYEKRSRQHLTCEELVEFLAYLESQPTP